ncbi:hypothetical protein CPC735_049020 [Coccidioides posadasii C735 delta SOWgp]|uniref:Uncharacterized protein n=1 Tax=Coccidioides posadasii (strain C735) TaxID=222929 RepID=C5PG79_COCP7|nr:hypothetical protein CPC735_049020 [Coccidioides posadasii C735 delta SOWgp]EER23532.1 hypothetical protein CPC735_049020 [Coccidioides posadasii C735 delta SOWgp]|eukprot:XP_003065677.1 hypothetical protein CPC735_049020 [Coccidioides posadasii C735 delta SOWgp]
MDSPQGRSETETRASMHTRASSVQTPTTSQLRQPLPPHYLASVNETVSFEPRPSRSSSIVSTRTGLTIGTLQDETRSIRSVDLTIGGRLFHINRDASRISILEPIDLPPYSPPPHGFSSLSQVIGEAEQTHPHPIQRSVASSGSADEVLHTNSDEQTVGRSLSFNPGPDKLSVIPKRRSASQGNIPDSAYSRAGQPVSPLRRRNGVRLPRIFTSIPHERDTCSEDTTLLDNESGSIRVTRSAGPRIGGGEVHSRSPSYIGQNAHGKFPTCVESTHLTCPHTSYGGYSRNTDESQILAPQSPARVEENHADGTTPPSMDSENDISIHYSRLIRSIDRDNRKALNLRDKELATMRVRLNELDQVYRKELKSRDFTIDDLRKRLQHLEEQMQSRIEKSQNEVEEQWESRWKLRDRHYMERMRRMELDFQKQLEQAVSDRDSEWAAELKRMNDKLLKNIGGTGSLSD